MNQEKELLNKMNELCGKIDELIQAIKKTNTNEKFAEDIQKIIREEMNVGE